MQKIVAIQWPIDELQPCWFYKIWMVTHEYVSDMGPYFCMFHNDTKKVWSFSHCLYDIMYIPTFKKTGTTLSLLDVSYQTEAPHE